MSELNWVQHPKTRVELMASVARIAEDAMGGGRFEKHMNNTIDLDAKMVAIFSDEYISMHLEKFAEMLAESVDDLQRPLGFAYALGFIAGAYYKELDDHQWKEDDDDSGLESTVDQKQG